MYYNYYLKWLETDSIDKINQTAYRISKRWLEFIDLSCATQEEIDSIMKELLSPNDFVGTGWSSMTYDFRQWAEENGFIVPSKKQLEDKDEKIRQNFIRKIREEDNKGDKKNSH